MCFEYPDGTYAPERPKCIDYGQRRLTVVPWPPETTTGTAEASTSVPEGATPPPPPPTSSRDVPAAAEHGQHAAAEHGRTSLQRYMRTGVRDRLCGPEDLNMSAPIRPTSDESSADADRPCHRWPIQQWVCLVRRTLGWRPPTRRCQKKRRDRATRAAIKQEVSRFLEDAEGASRVAEQSEKTKAP